MPRGGRRAGASGQSYRNRSDLNTALPPTAPTGQTYGVAKTQLDAQRAVPMAPAPSSPGQVAPSAGAPPPAPAGAPPLLPGEAGGLLRPTDRPSEPVTAGVPSGPGPGLEALGLNQPGSGGLSAVIQQAAVRSGSADLGFLAERAQVLGQ